MSGYHVRWEALRREAKVYGECRRNAQEARDELLAAFDRDRNTLGHDAYGAELAKHLPGVEQKIFDSLKEYIDELDGVASGLQVNARDYERPEQPPAGRN